MTHSQRISSAQLATWNRDGFLVLRPVIGEDLLRPATVDAERALASEGRRGAGVRDALRWESLRAVAEARQIVAIGEALAGVGAMPTRAILFDKSPDANWDVAWHQDTTIAVNERLEVAGFGPWSVKSGIVHVNPPGDVLARVATLRIHLDPCPRENGALLVVPGSHAGGIRGAIDVAASESAAVCCEVEAGGVVAMRPLLLHASRRAVSPAHRRVLHLEFASGGLPGGLRWARA